MQDLLDALGYVGSSLDKLGPRPLRGLLAGHPRELASIVPFSDELGLTDPNEVQSGRDVTNNFGITRKGDTGFGSDAAGTLADLIIDPIGLAAGGYGAYRGAKGLVHAAGNYLDNTSTNLKAINYNRVNRRGFNDFLPFPEGTRQINSAADWLGPRYSVKQGRDVVENALIERSTKRLGQSISPFDQLDRNMIRLDPYELKRLYSEIHPDSKILSTGGGEGPVLETPYGTVIKIAPTRPKFDAEGLPSGPVTGMSFPTGRAQIPEVLRPIRSVDFGAGNMDRGVRVEHLHKVNPLGHEVNMLEAKLLGSYPRVLANPELKDDFEHARKLLEMVTSLDLNAGQHVASQIKQKYPGLEPFDVNSRNLSRTDLGNLVVHDGGAIAGIGSSVRPYPSAPMPDAATRRDLLKMGGPAAIRQGLEEAGSLGPGLQGVRWPTPEAHAVRTAAIKQIEDFLAAIGGSVAPGSGKGNDSMSALMAALGTGSSF